MFITKSLFKKSLFCVSEYTIVSDTVNKSSKIRIEN